MEDDGKGFEKRAFGVSDVVWNPDRSSISITATEGTSCRGKEGREDNLLVQPLCRMDLVSLEGTVIWPHSTKVNIFTKVVAAFSTEPAFLARDAGLNCYSIACFACQFLLLLSFFFPILFLTQCSFLFSPFTLSCSFLFPSLPHTT